MHECIWVTPPPLLKNDPRYPTDNSITIIHLTIIRVKEIELVRITTEKTYYYLLDVRRRVTFVKNGLAVIV